MDLKRLILSPLILIFAASGYAQQTSTQSVTKDPQAIAVLSRSLNAAGGIPAVAAIHDYTGSGNITYYRGGGVAQGPATARARAVDEFRLDANLPDGMQSFVASNGAGSLVTTNGESRPLSFFNLIGIGSMILPIRRAAFALNDPTASIELIGVSSVDGQQTYQVRVSPQVDTFIAATPAFRTLGTFELFVSQQSFQIVELSETIWVGGALQPCSREILFANFNSSNGFIVPFTITERIAGQRTWTLNLNSFTTNSGVADAVFNP
jgi:hypothetical protein